LYCPFHKKGENVRMVLDEEKRLECLQCRDNGREL
jgi:hypothetical protein